MDLLLALDLGSSSVRAGWFDLAGNVVGSLAAIPLAATSDVTGRSSFPPDAILGAVAAAIDKALASQPPGDIQGVGFSSFWHSLLGLDAEGRPTTDVLTWADRRAVTQASLLRERPSAATIYQRTGCPAHSSYWPARLRWLAAAFPELFRSTRTWVSAADYIYLSFFGSLGTSLSMASGTGCFDLLDGQWWAPALAIAGIDEAAVPPIVDEPAAGLIKAYADRWPKLRDLPWFRAVGDGACSNIGVGCMEPDELVLMLGTSGSMRIVADHAAWNPAGGAQWCYRVDRGRFASGMALSEGGAVAAWARRTLNLDEATIDSELGARPPDGHGLTMLPYLLGMRSPSWQESRTAVVAGMTVATTPLDIYQAALESVGLRFAALYDELVAGGSRFRRIVGTGGGFSRSRLWAQIVCDCIGEDILITEVDEASLRGAALLAAQGLGLHQAETDKPVSFDRLEPRGERHDVYRRALQRQEELLAAGACRAEPGPGRIAPGA